MASDTSRTSNIAFLTDSAETVDLDFGLIHQNTEGPRLTRILGLGKNRVT